MNTLPIELVIEIASYLDWLDFIQFRDAYRRVFITKSAICLIRSKDRVAGDWCGNLHCSKCAVVYHQRTNSGFD